MYQAYKQWIARLLALLLLIFLSPLFVLVAILVKLNDGGPVFFKQERIGKDGKTFHLLKFRSMHVNAESIHLQRMDNAEIDVLNFKHETHSEITTIGKFIRKTSVDELPQLINVLKGDMVLIGPRPLQQKEVDTYSVDEATRSQMLERHSIYPGLICYWQVVPGKNSMSFEERMALDCQYVKEMSFLTDVQLIAQGIQTVLRFNNS